MHRFVIVTAAALMLVLLGASPGGAQSATNGKESAFAYAAVELSISTTPVLTATIANPGALVNQPLAIELIAGVSLRAWLQKK